MVVFENVYDFYNIGVVMRICDVVGIWEIYVFYIEN